MAYQTKLYRMLAKLKAPPKVNVTVPTPSVSVTVPTPTVNVTVPTPTVTVNAPSADALKRETVEGFMKMLALKDLDRVRLRGLVRLGIASPEDLITRSKAEGAAKIAADLTDAGTKVTAKTVEDWVDEIKDKFGLK